jgi:hypothetical protein
VFHRDFCTMDITGKSGADFIVCDTVKHLIIRWQNFFFP